MKLNFNEYKDKVYACWTGKNIGGTIGGPYEGKREVLDVKGFATKSGEPLRMTILICNLYGYMPLSLRVQEILHPKFSVNIGFLL